jgi:hypothetical protein
MAREEEGFFDELARGLADGTLTRGKALRLMGAALVGGTLGSLGIGEAGADPPGCKRLGKHCTRDEQCCGNLVCPSGACQTPTTTTTETPTTTTSTSTTSTSTTTCSGLPNGASCTEGSQCCSGNCSNGFCCESGRVGLSNGTCAKPCTLSGRECTGCFSPSPCTRTSGFATYCSGGFTNCLSNSECLSGQCTTSAGFQCVCSSDNDCPTGQFCAHTVPGSTQDFCQLAC